MHVVLRNVTEQWLNLLKVLLTLHAFLFPSSVIILTVKVFITLIIVLRCLLPPLLYLPLHSLHGTIR